MISNVSVGFRLLFACTLGTFVDSAADAEITVTTLKFEIIGFL